MKLDRAVVKDVQPAISYEVWFLSCFASFSGRLNLLSDPCLPVPVDLVLRMTRRERQLVEVGSTFQEVHSDFYHLPERLALQ